LIDNSHTAMPRRSVLAAVAAAPGAAMIAVAPSALAQTAPKGAAANKIRYLTQKVGDVEVYDREAGPTNAPAILEITANRNGASNDTKADAAVKFTALVTRERGHVCEEALRNVRRAGYGDPEIIEFVLHVALSMLTNHVNEVAKTDVDFPMVHAHLAA